MKGLASFIVSILDIAPGRVLAALGMGFVSYAAVGAVITSLVTQLTSTWNGIGGAGLQLISLAGFPTGLGIVIGAIVARVSLTQIPKLGKIT